jgi:methylthioribose-1-phosphate isomerase
MSLPPISRSPLSGSAAFAAVELDPETFDVFLLEQRLLPARVEYVRCRTPEDVVTGIRTMVVRGAPAIGVAAGYAMAQAARAATGDAASFVAAIARARTSLDAARPTAVNLAWATARMAARATEAQHLAPAERATAMRLEAEAIHVEDVAACRAMGELGANDVPRGATILTHCNAGALATGGYGTALGVIRAAYARGLVSRVLASETRPYLQGARLTAWELFHDGIPVEVITDSMVGHFLSKGAIQFAVVGADRIAANGDVANKIGTYGHAVLCHAHGVPFTVAAPMSTIDLATKTGAEIPIEERSREEVARIGDHVIVADGIPCRHPAFDVTPARYLAAIYTERGRINVGGGESPSAFVERSPTRPAR